ncbi:MAG: hypothetical protein Q9185_000293 [Variospora sp. 1 TL-2023]
MGLLTQNNPPSIKVRLAFYMLIIPVLIFYGLCVGTAPQLACIPSLGVTPDQVIKEISLNVNAARSNILSTPNVRRLLKIALDNQNKTMSYVLLAAGFFFLFGLLSLLILQITLRKAQPKPNAARKVKILKRLMLSFLWTSTALAFGASFATTQLAKILQHTSTSATSVVAESLVIEQGAGLEALQWLAAAFSFLFTTGVAWMFLDAGDRQHSMRKGDSGSDDVPEF